MYSTVQYSTVQYSTVQYSTVQYSTVQNSTVQYSTVQYSTVQYLVTDHPLSVPHHRVAGRVTIKVVFFLPPRGGGISRRVHTEFLPSVFLGHTLNQALFNNIHTILDLTKNSPEAGQVNNKLGPSLVPSQTWTLSPTLTCRLWGSGTCPVWSDS